MTQLDGGETDSSVAKKKLHFYGEQGGKQGKMVDKEPLSSLEFTISDLCLHQKCLYFSGFVSMCLGVLKLPIVLNNCNKGWRRNLAHVGCA